MDYMGRKCFWAFVLGIVVLLSFTFWYGGLSFGEIVKTLLYHVNLTLIGFMIALLCLSRKKVPFFILFSLSFPLGLCVENLLFLGLKMSHLIVLLRPLWILLGLCSLISLRIHHRKVHSEDDFPIPLVGGNLMIIGLLMFFTALWCFPQYTLPRGDESHYMYEDILWHLGNVEETIHHWPLQDPRFSGTPFYYHLFTYFHLASQTIVTGVSSQIVVFRTFIPLFLLWTSILSFALAQYLWKNPLKSFVAIALLFFTASLEIFRSQDLWFLNTFFTGLFYSLTFLFSLPLFLGFILFFFLIGTEKMPLIPIILLGMLLWVLTGGKGPGGLLILAALWGVLMSEALRKKSIAPSFILLCVSSLLIFSLCYFLFINPPGLSARVKGLTFSPLYTIFASPFYNQVINSRITSLLKIPRLIVIFLLIPVYFLGFFTYRFIIIPPGRRMLTQWKILGLPHTFFIILSLFSFAGGFFLKAKGQSQMYFFLYGYFVISLYAGALSYDFFLKKRTLVRLLLAGAILCSGFSITRLFNDGFYMTYKKTYLHNKIRGAITGHEVALINQLRNMTNPDDIILGNAFYTNLGKERAGWYYGSAIGGRRFFLEGWYFGGVGNHPDFQERKNLAMAVLSGNQAASLLSQNHNVHYIVWYRQHASPADPAGSKLKGVTKLFENPAGAIFAISPQKKP